MNTLSIAIYLEGNSDVKVLPILVQRIVQQFVNVHGWAERGWDDVEALPIQPLNDVIERDLPDLRSRLKAAARHARGYDLLLVHRDADAPTTRKARSKIAPALRYVEQARSRGEKFCGTILLLIPIREMEAWLLTDAEALRSVLNLTPEEEIRLPQNPQEVENCDPKARLNQIVQTIALGTDLNDIYEELAGAISLDKLKPLRGYQEFKEELKNAFIALQIVAPDADRG